MNEFLKVALTACIPALTVIFGWGLNKGVSIANGYIGNKFAQTCLQNAANAVFNAVQYVNQTYVDALKEADDRSAGAQPEDLYVTFSRHHENVNTNKIIV